MPSANILVVEDDPSIRHVLRETLADEGYAVREVANGQLALDLLASWTPDLIVLDLMMPTMDGRSFRRRQRELDRAPAVPIVVLTASRTPPDAAEFGTATVVPKPFELEELVSAIRLLLAAQLAP